MRRGGLWERGEGWGLRERGEGWGLRERDEGWGLRERDVGWAGRCLTFFCPFPALFLPFSCPFPVLFLPFSCPFPALFLPFPCLNRDPHFARSLPTYRARHLPVWQPRLQRCVAVGRHRRHLRAGRVLRAGLDWQHRPPVPGERPMGHSGDGRLHSYVSLYLSTHAVQDTAQTDRPAARGPHVFVRPQRCSASRRAPAALTALRAGRSRRRPPAT